MARRLFLSGILCCVSVCCAAQEETCYPPGGVAGIVVATIIVTVVVGGLAAAVGWKLWNRKQGDLNRRRGTEAPPAPKTSTTEFAFDNPYFRDSEDPEKGKLRSSLNNKNSLRSSKISDFSSKTKKPRGSKNPFTFGGGGAKKHRALDDSCLQVEPERTVVNLRGHDFTGLGFNICGNMRDGILVKDVLHRGPASESGLIKAGDKIISVTVSFTNIVYEDALTILSYASPYDVQLELERIPDKSRALPNTPSGTKRPLGSCSFNRSGQKLFHPLYRSQSIDDLTQIDRDSSLPPTLGLGPRRSQSVGVAAHKLAAHFKNSDSKLLSDDKTVSPNQILSTTGSLNEKMLANVMSDGSPHWKKRFEDTLEGDVKKPEEASVEPEKKTTTEASQSYSKKKKYLDSPHGKGKLEAFKAPVEQDHQTDRRARTMAEASNALWQLDQSVQGEDGSESSSTWNPEDGAGSQNKGYSHVEDDNESDVSHDSLEFSNKKKGRGKKHSTDDQQTKVESANSPHKRKVVKKCAHHAESNKGKESKSEYSRNAERVYVNNILNKSSVHSSSPKEDQKVAEEVKCIDRTPPAVYANHREIQEKALNSRGVPKTVANDQSNYGKVNGRNGYPDRQKPPENYSASYAGSSRVMINGETDEAKSLYTSNLSSYSNQARSSPSPYQKHDGAKSDEVMRWMENKNKSNASQKLSKAPGAPAGMFTQINPFQQPARHKNSNFKLWAARDDASANGNDSQYTSSLNNSYGSDSPRQLNRRDNVHEIQPYVSKTVVISPYESSRSNPQVLSYRQQH